MEKCLILIRHAHRDLKDRGLDNGLSSKGAKQAARLQRYASRVFSESDVREADIVSSPKRRCLETVEPLAKELGLRVTPDKALLEQEKGESFAAFSERIHVALKKYLTSSAPLTILCGHGDWLPLATFHLLGLAVEMKKGSWMEVRWDGCQGELRSYIPCFRELIKVASKPSRKAY